MNVSVDVQARPNGKYQIRWREDGRRRARTVSGERNATRLASKIRQRLEGGGMVRFDAEIPTLGAFVETWLEVYAIPALAPKTRATYVQMWGKHVVDRLGDKRLREITAGVVDTELVQPMRRAKVGEPTIVKTLTMLQSVMSLAVLHHPDVVATNPVAQLRKPKQRRREGAPLWPTLVEQLAAARWMVGKNDDVERSMSQRDRTMIFVLAYAGLRPGELLGLRWRDVRDDHLAIDGALSDGERRGDDETKRHDRSVDLLAPLAQDLREYRLACGRPVGDKLVFPRPDGEAWVETDWRNWRRRIYQRAAKEIGLTSRRPYDLRGSFVSLLVHEGRTIVEVAEQSGHTAETLLRHYARVFRDAPPPAERVSAAETIRRARDTDQQRLAL